MPDKVKKLPKLRWLVLAGVVLLLALQFGSYALFGERQFVESIKANVLYALTHKRGKIPDEKSLDCTGLHVIGHNGYSLDPRFYAGLGQFVLKYSKSSLVDGIVADQYGQTDERGNASFLLQPAEDSLIVHYLVFPGDFPLFTRDIQIEYEAVRSSQKLAIVPKSIFIHQIWLFGNWHVYKEYKSP